MLRYIERKRSSRPSMPGPGATAGEDPDADALTVMLLFERHDRRNHLTRLYLRREKLSKDFRGREKRLARSTRRTFLRELCHRGLLEYQGDRADPHRDCPRHVRGECSRFPLPERGR